jgi:hypothetical protein
MAEAPPPNGLLVSIVSWTLATPFAGRFTLMGEKWQFTPAGSDAHPNPMVSAKPEFELRLTVTVMFCEVGTVNVEGVTPKLNPTGVPETVSAEEVDGP